MKQEMKHRRFTLRLFDSERTEKRINELKLNKKYGDELTGDGEKKKKKNLYQRVLKKPAATATDLKQSDTSANEETSPCEAQNAPDKYLEAGKTLPKAYSKHLSQEMIGRPLEEIDDFYKSDHVRAK
jgi:hypothetical protein